MTKLPYKNIEGESLNFKELKYQKGSNNDDADIRAHLLNLIANAPPHAGIYRVKIFCSCIIM